MIIQEFYWDNEKILTIIHEKMENEIKNRTLNEETKISDHEIIFKEFYSENIYVEDFEYNFVIRGFLECENVKNPYSNYSTQYKEFVNQENNPLINNDQLTIETRNFKELCAFVKENSNFNLTPSSIGNLFVFSPIKIEVKSHNSESFPYLNINGKDAHGTAFVKFKLEDIILESYVVDNISDGSEIWSKGDWDNYEIEIYDEGTLIYKSNYYIIRAINIKMGITTRTIEKKYQSISSSILITNTDMSNKITISDKTYLDFLGRYLNNEKIETNKHENPKDSHCTFLKKNERDKAFKIFEDIIKKNEEIWIFDPFFISDNSGISVLIDILTMLCSTPETKNIIFTENIANENEEKNMTFTKYKSQIEKHGQESLRDLNLNSLNFIKAKDKFHDRFIFIKTDERIIGYQIGTSLNSFGTNYSNIIKLNDYCAKNIFEILNEDIVSNNIFKLGDLNEF